MKIESTCLEIIESVIIASLETNFNKLSSLNSTRIKIEILKKLFRTIYELKIIDQKKYIELELDLQELSKMTNGWIKYLKNN